MACKAAGACKNKLPTKVTGPSCPVTFTQVDGSYLATTEFSASSSFDPDTLKLKESPFKFGPDKLGAMHESPSHDVMLADGVRVHHFAENTQNIVYEIAAGSRVREQCAATVEDKTDKGSRYQHQVLGTAEWYIMFQGPCFGGFGAWDWEPTRGTRVRLINRRTGATQDYWTTTNYFTVHQANAYVDGDDLVADLVASDVGCEKLTVNFKLGTLRDPTAHAMNWSHTEQAFRLRLPLKKPNATVTPQLISPLMGVEFPVMSPNVLGLKHTHAYMSQLTTPESGWYDAVVKMNMQTGETKVFNKPGFYVGEPVYAPSPGEGLEDDNGVAFAVALDTANKVSFLWVLDAKTWTLSASLQLPEMLPFQYHGRYYDHTLN